MTQYKVPLTEIIRPDLGVTSHLTIVRFEEDGVMKLGGLYLIDTGSDKSFISDEAAAKLKLHSLKETSPIIVRTASGGSFDAYPTIIDKFWFGSYLFEELQLYIGDFNGQDIMLNGIIGLDILSHFSNYTFTDDYLILEK